MITVEVTKRFVDVVVTGDLAEHDLDALFSALDTSARRGAPFAVVTDTTDMKSAPRSVLKVFADRLKRMPSMKHVWVADAVVAVSATTRFLLSTLILIAPMPTAVKVFEHREEAEQWCWLMLQKAQHRDNASV